MCGLTLLLRYNRRNRPTCAQIAGSELSLLLWALVRIRQLAAPGLSILLETNISSDDKASVFNTRRVVMVDHFVR